MLHIDAPTTQDVTTLNSIRADACVSIYVPTTPLTQDIDKSRIEYGNSVKEAVRQLEEAGVSKDVLDDLTDHLATVDDDAFWRLQVNSLAVFATRDMLFTFRLANRLKATVQVSDRFHLKPLLRARAFPHEALVLAVSENGVRLVEVSPDTPPVVVAVPNLPRDAASHAGKATLNDRSPTGRIQGSEGQRVRHLQYLRAIDGALRPILTGRSTPLIIAAVDPMAALYPHVNTYANLLPTAIKHSPEALTDAELAKRAIPILDDHHAAEVARVRALFETRSDQGRVATDLTDAARAATFGAVDTLLVDIDSSVPGTIRDDGTVATADTESASSYDLVDEIMGRVIATGGRVLAVRRSEVPAQGELAAILRWAP